MSEARLSRNAKRQLGQYFTPQSTAAAIVGHLSLTAVDVVLEPSFGGGSFVFAIAARMSGSLQRREFRAWRSAQLHGCEVDQAAYGRFAAEWKSRGWGPLPRHLERADFFTWMPAACERSAATNRRHYFASRLEQFDLVIGNPPFGASINPEIQDELDAIFGFRDGMKIKKESYAFFIVKSIDLLKPGGRLVFICSDTILTIATMTGLRNWIHNNCDVQVSTVPGSFDETNQDMILLTLTKTLHKPAAITVFGRSVPLAEIEATPNLSWRVDSSFARFFTGATVGDKMIASSGMTIGNNELFLRRIVDGQFTEPYEFSLAEAPITVERELERARLGKIGPARLRELRKLESEGATEITMRAEQRPAPVDVRLPHEDYCFYNKASSQILCAPPEWVIFWRDNGQYVYTFKKNGNWYLHGVGGKKYFQREGLTWALIAPRLYARYLPAGYILDSGAPCAFLREGVPHDELFFILGWALTDECTAILKNVLNHTRNIQSKDFERLPYPVWVDRRARRKAIETVKRLVDRAKAGESLNFKNDAVRGLEDLYAWREASRAGQDRDIIRLKHRPRQAELF
jgi:hypothetical protein